MEAFYSINFTFIPVFIFFMLIFDVEVFIPAFVGEMPKCAAFETFPVLSSFC